MKEGKNSFFEKKEQKNFYVFIRVQPQRARQEAKVFWFFFSKKNCFLPFLMTVLACPQPDWLAHTLTVSGPADDVAAFRDQAAGAGVIPWVFDLDQMQEDWFCRLLAPGNDISVQGARILAQTYRGLVSAQHERAVASVGHSRACPFDLHALAPVPVRNPAIRSGRSGKPRMAMDALGDGPSAETGGPYRW